MTPAALEPPGAVPAGERIAVLDIVRGFALLGILIMNMPGFNSSFFVEADGSHLWTGAVDRAAETAREVLFSGKFNSMFSLLFGIGFTIQYGRMRERAGSGATALYLRRLAVLLGFGLVHALVFWPGDVLHIYAVLGIVLLFGLRDRSDRTIFLLIGLCLLYPAVAGTLRTVLMTPDVVARLTAEAQAWEASNNVAFGHGSFLAAVRETARETSSFYADPWSLWGFTIGFYVQMTTTMLMGVLIGRHGLPQRIGAFMPWVRRLQWWALGIGVVGSVGFGVLMELFRDPGPSLWKALRSECYVFSRVGMMSFYVLTIVRLAQQPAWQRRFAPFAAAGRMPLTNYLMQTAICITLFHGWGFGLWGRVGPALSLVLSFVIFFAVQVPWSLWWLARHEQGPLEALWRRLTYGAPVIAEGRVRPADGV